MTLEFSILSQSRSLKDRECFFETKSINSRRVSKDYKQSNMFELRRLAKFSVFCIY